jgi:RimJ/RimL family protein N-acetyltransferase
MIVFETNRLVIRTASADDADLYFALWTNPKVMSNVGFPMGLRITFDEVEAMLEEQTSNAEFGRNLVVELRSSNSPVGECKMYQPDAEGVAKTDVKLLPEYWRNRYGVEVKQGLLDHLFRHTSCRAVEGTPNVENKASIKMQEAVGGVRVGEDVHHFPEDMMYYTHPVHHYIYLVYREEWERRRSVG